MTHTDAETRLRELLTDELLFAAAHAEAEAWAAVQIREGRTPQEGDAAGNAAFRDVLVSALLPSLAPGPLTADKEADDLKDAKDLSASYEAGDLVLTPYPVPTGSGTHSFEPSLAPGGETPPTDEKLADSLLRAFEYCHGRHDERAALAKEQANVGNYRAASEYCSEARGFASSALFVKRERDALTAKAPEPAPGPTPFVSCECPALPGEPCTLGVEGCRDRRENRAFMAALTAEGPTPGRDERELCKHCGGNGTVKIHHGVSYCPRCHGDCWEPQNLVPPVPTETTVDGLNAEGWQATARDMANNAEFYRGLVVQIGEMFGVAARTCDDGSICEDVLALKVPELVAALLKPSEAVTVEQGWALRRKVDGWWLAEDGKHKQSIMKAVTNTEDVARMCAGETYEPVYLERRVSVREGAPK